MWPRITHCRLLSWTHYTENKNQEIAEMSITVSAISSKVNMQVCMLPFVMYTSEYYPICVPTCGPTSEPTYCPVVGQHVY